MTRAVGRLSVVWLVTLLVSASAYAQTSRPTVTPGVVAPAVGSAFDHETIRRTGGTGLLGSEKSKAGETPTGTFDTRRVVLSLAIVLGLIFAIRWVSRWMFPGAAVGRSSQVITVLSRSVVAPKQQFLLVQVGKRLVLVGDSGTQMNALTVITDPDEVAALVGQLKTERTVAEPASRFGPFLGRAEREFNKTDDVPPVDDGSDEDVVADDDSGGELTDLTAKIRLLSRQLGKM